MISLGVVSSSTIVIFGIFFKPLEIHHRLFELFVSLKNYVLITIEAYSTEHIGGNSRIE